MKPLNWFFRDLYESYLGWSIRQAAKTTAGRVRFSLLLIGVSLALAYCTVTP